MIKKISKWFFTDMSNKSLEKQGYELIRHREPKLLEDILSNTEELGDFMPTKVFTLNDIYRDVWDIGNKLPLYKRILNSMPSTLRESLVAWYSPNLQGLTNAELQDSNKKLVGGLKDLSENGNDMDLNGFVGVDEEDGYVDGDGNLYFDGGNDYGITNDAITLSDMSVFLKCSLPQSLRDGYVFAARDEVGGITSSIFYLGCNHADPDKIFGKALSSFGKWQKVSIQMVQDDNEIGLGILMKNRFITKYGDVSILNGTTPQTTHLRLGSFKTNSYTATTLNSAILFNRTLNDTEIEWVKTNMLVSQTPKTNTITLYCGEFDEDGTLINEDIDVFTFSVQHGNSLNDADGNLLSKYHKDIDATHCTSGTWYDTDGLEYAGEAITEDCTFYCERMKISDYMLEQLDALTLSDGSTAKEHLVCWYQPKLQGLTKESVLTDKVLADLSGNGYDMTLYGFSEDSECIANDGIVIGEGNYANAQLPTINDFTIFADASISNATPGNGCGIALTKDRGNTLTQSVFYLYLGGNVGSFGNSKLVNSELASGKIEMIPTSINSYTIQRGSYVQSANDRLNFRFVNSTSTNVLNPLKHFIMFDVSIDAENRNIIKQILKLS